MWSLFIALAKERERKSLVCMYKSSNPKITKGDSPHIYTRMCICAHMLKWKSTDTDLGVGSAAQNITTNLERSLPTCWVQTSQTRLQLHTPCVCAQINIPLHYLGPIKERSPSISNSWEKTLHLVVITLSLVSCLKQPLKNSCPFSAFITSKIIFGYFVIFMSWTVHLVLIF